MAGLETVSADAARLIAEGYARAEACPLADYVLERLTEDLWVSRALQEVMHAPDDRACRLQLRGALFDAMVADDIVAVDLACAVTEASDPAAPVYGFTGLWADLPGPRATAGSPFSVFVRVQNPYDVPITVRQVWAPIPGKLVDVNRRRVEHHDRSRAAIAVGTELRPEKFDDLVLDHYPVYGDVFVEDGHQEPFAAVSYVKPGDEQTLGLKALMHRVTDYERDIPPVRLQPGDSVVRQFVLRTRARRVLRPFDCTLPIQVDYSVDGVGHRGTIPYRLGIRGVDDLGPVESHLLTYRGDNTDFDAWTAQLALRVLVDEALADPGITHALAEERIRLTDAEQAVLADGSVLARIRIEQDRVAREGRGGATRPAWAGSLTAAQCGWLAFVAVAGIGYVTLLRLAWPRLDFAWQLVSILATVAAIALSVTTAVRRAPGLWGLTDWHEAGAVRPDSGWLGLGDRHRFVREEIIAPAILEFVRSRRTLRYGTKLVYTEIAGLYEDDGSKIVLTAAAKRLRRIIERADTGAVALAGYRGVGKTTAIRAMQRGLLNSSDSASPLVVIASAPAHYDARDFVLHLHALLCNAVIAKVSAALEHIRPPTRQERWSLFWHGLRKFAICLLFIGICAGVAAILWGGGAGRFTADAGNLLAAAMADLPDSFPRLWSGQSFLHITALSLLGIAAVHIVWKTLGVPFSVLLRLGRRRRRRGLFALLREAKKELAQTRFLQTHTTGWSGKLSMPLKGEAGRTWSTQRAEQQLTHPEVVDKVRRFAGESAHILRKEGITDRMVIAIDELDKIGEQEKAHQFVNDLKGVFGAPGCLFFVSVSDDAVLNFEQRGVGVRDAFDSAFAEMVRLDYFTLDESRLWIALRLSGVPDQFCYLCHCLSGGLPRDLRRYAVDMVDVTTEAYQPSLGTVTATLMRTELTSKMHAFSAKAATLDPSPENVELTARLLAIADTVNPLELAEMAGSLVREATGDPADPTNTIRWHAGCFTLFSTTILEVFDNSLGRTKLTPELHQLALARQQMAMHPQLAWQRLQDFRKAYSLDAASNAATHSRPA